MFTTLTIAYCHTEPRISQRIRLACTPPPAHPPMHNVSEPQGNAQLQAKLQPVFGQIYVLYLPL